MGNGKRGAKLVIMIVFVNNENKFPFGFCCRACMINIRDLVGTHNIILKQCV